MSELTKHPRTLHLPWSPGRSRDDLVMEDEDPFRDKDVVVTAKMDGECTTLYRGAIHARSLTWTKHPSRDYVQALWARIKHKIPMNTRVCGENLYARHSIHYQNLDNYFLVHSVWHRDKCLEWQDAERLASSLGLKTVPVIYSGLGDRWRIKDLHRPMHNDDPCEGFVVRVASSFTADEYPLVVGKWVRSGHVQTDEHWLRQPVVPNKVRK